MRNDGKAEDFLYNYNSLDSICNVDLALIVWLITRSVYNLQHHDIFESGASRFVVILLDLNGQLVEAHVVYDSERGGLASLSLNLGS